MKKYAMAILTKYPKITFYGEYNPQQLFADLRKESILTTWSSGPNENITKEKEGGYSFSARDSKLLYEWLMKYLLVGGWEPYAAGPDDLRYSSSYHLFRLAYEG